MEKFNTVKRKCDVLVSGPVAELGSITGPVYGARLTNEQVIRLVTNGRRVKEINPNNPADKKELTIATCRESVFKNAEPQMIPVNKPEGSDTRSRELSNMSKKERKRMEWQERQEKQRKEQEAINAEDNKPSVETEKNNDTEE